MYDWVVWFRDVFQDNDKIVNKPKPPPKKEEPKKEEEKDGDKKEETKEGEKKEDSEMAKEGGKKEGGKKEVNGKMEVELPAKDKDETKMEEEAPKK